MIKLDKAWKPLRGEKYWIEVGLNDSEDVIAIDGGYLIHEIDDKYFYGYKLQYFINNNAELCVKPFKFATSSVESCTVEIPFNHFKVNYSGIIEVNDGTRTQQLEINDGFIEHFLPENIERRKNLQDFKSIINVLAKKYDVSVDVECDDEYETVDVVLSHSYKDKNGKYQQEKLKL